MPHHRSDSRKPTLTIGMEEELIAEIENYRFQYRKENRSAAIADLVKLGLRVVKRREERQARTK